MRHEYALLFSVAALGFVFSRQQAPASIVSPGPSKADVVPPSRICITGRVTATGERGRVFPREYREPCDIPKPRTVENSPKPSLDPAEIRPSHPKQPPGRS